MNKRVCIAIIVMGFSGLVAEILLLRELLIVFSGNELGIGIILANWLILEASGCLFPGRLADRSKNALETYTVITALLSLSVPIAVFLTRNLKSMLGVSIGESIGLVPTVYVSFLVLLPVSLLHGALFPFSCRIYSLFSGQAVPAAGRVYVYETIGTIIGGIVCTYLLIPRLNTFQAAGWLAVLNLIVCLGVLFPCRNAGPFRKAMLGVASALVLLFGYLVLGGQAEKLHRYSIQAQWKNLNIVHYQNSQYGNICVIENQGQYIFFQDGVPGLITPVPDIISVEEFVHLPLLAHPRPTRILVLSGGAGGVINEALKHASIETIEYAELDPLTLSLLRKFPTPLTESELNDERVQIRHVDGRLLLKTTPNTYDLILVGIEEPSNLQANRFFTQEFFSLAKSRLNEGGILVLGVPGSLTFLTEALQDLNSSIFHTLAGVFAYIRVIPGDERNVFLASDAPEISAIDKAQIVQRLNERNITASTIVPWYIENKLHHGWQDWFARFIERGSREINYDFKPVGLFYSISHWNALFAPSFGRLFEQFEKINLGVVFLAFILSLPLYFFLRSRARLPSAGISLAIVTTGFAGMIFDLVVIFAFQAIYGYVFSWIGLLVASFMAGATCGATLIMALARIQHGLRLFIKTELAIICFAVGLPLVFVAFRAYAGGENALFTGPFLIISFVGGLLTGSQFPLANELYLKSSASVSRTAGLLYASDLLGGWLGGIVGAVVLLPVLGLAGTCITVGLLKLTSFVIMFTQSRSCS